jgi:hypothetical protein
MAIAVAAAAIDCKMREGILLIGNFPPGKKVGERTLYKANKASSKLFWPQNGPHVPGFLDRGCAQAHGFPKGRVCSSSWSVSGDCGLSLVTQMFRKDHVMNVKRYLYLNRRQLFIPGS